MKIEFRGDRYFRPLRAALLVLSLAAGLSACAAIPPAVTVANLAATGLSYATTGKGTTDHLLSGATEQDCALHRSLMNRPVCRDVPASATAAFPGKPAALRDPAVQRLSPRPENIREIMRSHTLSFAAGNN